MNKIYDFPHKNVILNCENFLIIHDIYVMASSACSGIHLHIINEAKISTHMHMSFCLVHWIAYFFIYFILNIGTRSNDPHN